MFSQKKYTFRGVIFILLFFISFTAFSTDASGDASLDPTSDYTNIQYLQGLVEKLSSSPFAELFQADLRQAQGDFNSAKELLETGEREGAIAALKEVEELLVALLEREKQLELEDIRVRAHALIVEAGMALEEASFSLYINDKGEPAEGFVYKFNFETAADYRLTIVDPEEVSYIDAVIKAAIYLEQAKEAYKMKSYELAINYASLTAKVAELFQSNGIKEIYTIKRGDCLWTIAEKEGVYGSSFYWPLLYRANKTLIKEPDIIEPGDELIIPHLE